MEGEIVQTNIVKNANQDVVFKCEVMGEQTIQVEWHVNGESIFEEDGEGGALKDKFANNVCRPWPFRPSTYVYTKP